MKRWSTESERSFETVNSLTQLTIEQTTDTDQRREDDSQPNPARKRKAARKSKLSQRKRFENKPT